MRTHNQLVRTLLRRPGARAEVARIEREEAALLDALLKARQDVYWLREPATTVPGGTPEPGAIFMSRPSP